MNKTRPAIPATLSIYLDAVRFLAAVSVVLHHTWGLFFSRFPLPWPGHSAVVVFFVISGYVIAHAVSHPKATLGSYVGHRVARVFSVSIPALLIGLLITPVAGPIAGLAPLPSSGPLDVSMLDLLKISIVSLLFMGQSWWLEISPPYNLPFWSLCYEVWYYAIFAAWTYAPPRFRLITTAVLATVAGPKILLLMPVWILGVTAYRWRPQLSQVHALALFASSTVAGLLFFWFDVAVAIRIHMIGNWPEVMSLTRGSNMFVGDFLLGLIISANFIAVACLTNVFHPIVRLEKLIRYCASFTFSTYLYHAPIAIFIWNVLSVHSALGFYGLLGLGIFILAQGTERRTSYFRALVAHIATKSSARQRSPNTNCEDKPTGLQQTSLLP